MSDVTLYRICYQEGSRIRAKALTLEELSNLLAKRSLRWITVLGEA